jgi:hypothetical protein
MHPPENTRPCHGVIDVTVHSMSQGMVPPIVELRRTARLQRTRQNCQPWRDHLMVIKQSLILLPCPWQMDSIGLEKAFGRASFGHLPELIGI